MTTSKRRFSRIQSLLEALAEGAVLRGPFWSEPVRVLIAKKRGNQIEIKAMGMRTHRFYPKIIDIPDFEAKVRIEATGATPTFSGEASKFRLAIEALRIRLAHEYDPHFAVSVSQIDAVPHQLEAVYHYLFKRPRIRFLLADDAGAGKTIMAGLLLKELKCRGAIERTLIVTPAYLVDQWMKELREKFGEDFIHVTRAFMDTASGRNIWEQHNQFIVSMDFAKQEDVLDTLRNAHWDLVMVDEAHKIAAYRYGEEIKRTERRWLGEALSERTDHLLFLTATPHKGDPENFLLLLQLLDKDLFSSMKILEEAVRWKENLIFLRRLKEDMTDFDGRPIFPHRYTHTVNYELSGQEKQLYDEVTKYVVEQYQRAVRMDNRNVINFTLPILQRRLASSIRAIRRSLERIRERRLELKRKGLVIREEIKIPEDIEDFREQDRWRYEEGSEGLTLTTNMVELESEIREVKRLVELAKGAEKIGVEKKLEELRNVIHSRGIAASGEKLLIFTEFKETLDYLIENLRRWGFRVTCIHGDMPFDARREAERELNEGHAQIMVATEAAGEGINLQYRCSLMLNYDIPWNPTRLEQRMGRIHRYKQKKEVHIYNLVAANTREGNVLTRIFEKLELMRKHLGHDRVYDVVGEFFMGRRLDELIMDALANRRSMKETERIIDTSVGRQNVEKVKEATLESLATRYIDFSAIKLEMEQAKEHRLVPEYIEHFFVETFQSFGGRMSKRIDGYWRIDHVPTELRRASPKFTRRFGQVKDRYPKATFYKEQAKDKPSIEFMALGHPLFEAVLQAVIEKLSNILQEGAVFMDPDGQLNGLLWFVKSGVQDGSENTIGERIFVIHQALDGSLHDKGAFLLHDLKPLKSAKNVPEDMKNLYKEREKIIDWSLGHALQQYFKEIRSRHLREIEVRGKYLKKSMNALIADSIRRLGEYEKKAERGVDMTMPTRREEARLEDLRNRRKRRLQEIEQERHLTLATPDIIGVASVVPMKFKGPKAETMVRDEEVEAVAMQAAMDYEREQGRVPEDVTGENLGFDIRSKGDSEIRYIEVKGRAYVGSVALTPNEWIKAQRLGNEYWLYIVVNVRTKPQLYFLQNPASKLRPNKEVEIVRYLVKADQWQRVATLVEVSA